jgi:MPBQ/MSBQ methyltransferase
MLDFLYAEWSHPYFVSINAYKELMAGTRQLVNIGWSYNCSLATFSNRTLFTVTDDWTPQTLPSWRHSIWVGVYNPIPVLIR